MTPLPSSDHTRLQSTGQARAYRVKPVGPRAKARQKKHRCKNGKIVRSSATRGVRRVARRCTRRNLLKSGHDGCGTLAPLTRSSLARVASPLLGLATSNTCACGSYSPLVVHPSRRHSPYPIGMFDDRLVSLLRFCSSSTGGEVQSSFQKVVPGPRAPPLAARQKIWRIRAKSTATYQAQYRTSKNCANNHPDATLIRENTLQTAPPRFYFPPLQFPQYTTAVMNGLQLYAGTGSLNHASHCTTRRNGTNENKHA